MLMAGHSRLDILELGFGTGLNCLLTIAYQQYFQTEIRYTAIDNDPISIELSNQLNYHKHILIKDISQISEKLHHNPKIPYTQIVPGFELTRQTIHFDYIDMTKTFDLIYHDAFGPEVSPVFWTRPYLDKLFHITNPGGRLVTYCAKGQFKRDLRSAGYNVINVAGPPGKREMTIAIRGL